MHWRSDIMPCSADASAEEKRLKALWDSLPPDELAHYAALADQETCRRTQLEFAVGNGFDSFTETSRALSSDYARRKAQHIRGLEVVRAVREHRAWESGAKLDSMSHALRPELVDMASSRRGVEEAAARIFDYDATPSVNPRGTMRPFVSCCSRFGGLCKLDELCGLCASFTRHTHALLKSADITKDKLPILLCLEGVGTPLVEHHLVGDMFGNGLLQILLPVESVGAGSDQYRLVAGGVCGGASTSHLVARRMLRGMRDRGEHNDIIRVSVHGIGAVEGLGKFEFSRGDVIVTRCVKAGQAGAGSGAMKKDKDALPFGLGVYSVDEKKPGSAELKTGGAGEGKSLEDSYDEDLAMGLADLTCEGEYHVLGSESEHEDKKRGTSQS